MQISSLLYFPYYLNFLEPNDLGFYELSSILVAFSDVIFSAALILFYVKVAFGRTSIMNLMNDILKLKRQVSRFRPSVRRKSENCGKVLLYNIIVKVGLNCGVIVPVIILNVLLFVANPMMSHFIFGLLQPVEFVVYCYITSMYYIPFAFGLYLTRKISDDMMPENLYVISSCYQDILKYLRKVNSFMESVIFLLLFDGFVAVVGEVSHFT